jgi:hypothetical protein
MADENRKIRITFEELYLFSSSLFFTLFFQGKQLAEDFFFESKMVDKT